MSRQLILTAIAAIYFSCASNSAKQDKWLGETKRKLINKLGAPIRILDDEKDGEVLVYAEQLYLTSHSKENSKIAGPSYWNYQYVFIDKYDKVSGWKNEKQKFPPQALDGKKVLALTASR